MNEWVGTRVKTQEEKGGGGDALEVGELAEGCARGDDGEAEPDAPDDPAEDRDDLVAEELRGKMAV